MENIESINVVSREHPLLIKQVRGRPISPNEQILFMKSVQCGKTESIREQSKGIK